MKPVATSDCISISCWWFLLVRWSWMYSKITALLFIGAGGQNNTLVSACRHVCLHTCMLLSHDCKWLYENDIQLAWMLPSNNTHTHRHTQRSDTPILKLTQATIFFFFFTSDSFCWSLNASFPFGRSLSPLSLRLLMMGTSMFSACIFPFSFGSPHLLRG